MASPVAKSRTISETHLGNEGDLKPVVEDLSDILDAIHFVSKEYCGKKGAKNTGLVVGNVPVNEAVIKNYFSQAKKKLDEIEKIYRNSVEFWKKAPRGGVIKEGIAYMDASKIPAAYLDENASNFFLSGQYDVNLYVPFVFDYLEQAGRENKQVKDRLDASLGELVGLYRGSTDPAPVNAYLSKNFSGTTVEAIYAQASEQLRLDDKTMGEFFLGLGLNNLKSGINNIGGLVTKKTISYLFDIYMGTTKPKEQVKAGTYDISGDEQFKGFLNGGTKTYKSKDGRPQTGNLVTRIEASPVGSSFGRGEAKPFMTDNTVNSTIKFRLGYLVLDPYSGKNRKLPTGKSLEEKQGIKAEIERRSQEKSFAHEIERRLEYLAAPLLRYTSSK